MARDWKTEQAGRVSLRELTENAPVTVLVGTSGVGGAFKAHHVQKMMEHTARPIVFPLSNPTSNCEALPEDIYRWSQGQAIVATGSPFKPVTYEGQEFRIGQGNNVFIFPGVGLAAIVSRVRKITLEMFTAASFALADCVNKDDLAAGTVFPPMADLRRVSVHVATEVLKAILLKDPSHPLMGKDLQKHIQVSMWEPVYLPYRRV